MLHISGNNLMSRKRDCDQYLKTCLVDEAETRIIISTVRVFNDLLKLLRIMNKSSTSNETKCNTTNMSKLRRLKIEENLLLQNLKKLDQKRNYEESESDTTKDFACKKAIKNLKDSYINIKNLFDDIKIVSSTRELLAELEIDEIKKKVLELETTMRSFKLSLGTELNSLKRAEQELTKQLEDKNFKDAQIKKKAKISSVSFKQAVPSPVRLMMTSPLKSTEVQEFQDFMKNSPNRYGGWNEYHHNIFVKLWQKHFGNVANPQSDVYYDDLALVDSFVEESSIKLQSIDKISLMSHIDWYKKYLFFKSKQQIAIDKWKSIRSSMKKVPDNKKMQCSVQNDIEKHQQLKCVDMKKRLEVPEPIKKIISNEDIERVRAPTKQWISRCEYQQKNEEIPYIENLEKLRIPNWRQYLND